MQPVYKTGSVTMFAIDYDYFITLKQAHSKDSLLQLFQQYMPNIWAVSYNHMANGPTNILEIKDSGFSYLFDFASSPGLGTSSGKLDDRVVASWGLSQAASGARDAARMKGFIGNSSLLGDNTDKGHFMSHGTGGGLDINLFPQRRDLNQRRKTNPASYTYYDMEKYTRENPGTFYFSRPIYSGASWRPAWIEYGLIKNEGALWVEWFDNS